jgi:putative tryptophan/tyrosine transport system substrate-binding protein
MERREFIGLLGGVAAWPLAARAQPSAPPVIGFLHSGSPKETAKRLDAYLKGLKEQGFVDGDNVNIEYRWAGDNDKLAAMAAELVKRNVALISTAAARRRPVRQSERHRQFR